MAQRFHDRQFAGSVQARIRYVQAWRGIRVHAVCAGRIYDPESLDHEPAIVTVYADGKKIADEVVRKYDVPKRMKLDIAGADRLEFRIVKGEDDIGFA